jgi:hypothetical protein
LSVAPAGAQAQTFVDQINAERAAAGMGPLAVHPQLTSGAQGWAQHMAQTGNLTHDANIAGTATGWTKLGENVGTGGSVGQIQGAFMNSAQHSTNILDPTFTHVGVGVVVDINGQIWVTQRFMRAAGAPAPPPPAVTPAPAPAAPQPAPAPTPRPRATTPATAPASTSTSTTAPAPPPPPPPAPASPGRVAIVLDALHQLDA